ncbi:MAG: NAD(P)-binding protein [Muribaculum sp.]|nr:NAD(P)-binding protein [Muribaculum sp.]
MKYDYLIVGAGLFGSVFAHEMRQAGKTCLCIDKRQHVGGNLYTQEQSGIQVHKYGAHIFHTSNEEVWEYVNRFARFNHYINSPVAVYRDEIYNLPFNMNTFSRMWNIRTPREAQEIIERQRADCRVEQPRNLEEQALSLVGRDVYEKLVKGYTEKQWGKSCRELPAFIIKRLPVRFTYDNNYFTDPYQGIPEDGYTALIEKLLEGTTVRLGISYEEFCEKFVRTGRASVPGRMGNPADVSRTAETGSNSEISEKMEFGKVLYTGMIDAYFGYELGALEWRSLRFEEETLADCGNYQGNAVVNYTEAEVPYTRIIEHKHFTFGTGQGTVITREYPAAWKQGDEPYYPINDERNGALFAKYRELAERERGVLFGGRLGQYRYYDMDQVIAEALGMVRTELEQGC